MAFETPVCWKLPSIVPQTGYYADRIEEAAALWEGLSQHLPFLVGHKRTAFATTYTFLTIDGIRYEADQDETYDFVDELYSTGRFRFEQLVPWLRANCHA